MPEIIIVKRGPVPDASADAARDVLFGAVDGLGEVHGKRWRRFWNLVLRAEAGELFTVTTKSNRVGWYHRKHMAMEAAVFDGQERFADFEQFRIWLKIGAGHVTWMPGPKGAIVPVPKSISYSALDQLAMQEFHESVVEFLRTPRASQVLWPGAPAGAINIILEGFDE